MNTSQSQAAIAATANSVELSVKNLLKIWQRRERWRLFFTTSTADNPERAPWRIKLAHLLESMPLRIITIALLTIDLILTNLELSSSVACATPAGRNVNDTIAAREVIPYFHWTGIAILSLLLGKTVALCIALGSSIVRHPGYVVDGVVVSVALALETLVEDDGGGLVVVASLWRVVRVVESVFELSDEAIQAEIEGVVRRFEALREENMRALESIAEKDMMIEKLQEELSKCGA